VTTRLPSLRRPPIGFAHRGARAHAPENTIEAFSLALRLGATGLESDVWVTSDGIAVLDHDGIVGSPLRRRSVAGVARARLPTHVPTVAELYTACGTGFEFSVDVKDPAAAQPLIVAAVAAGLGAAGRLWLCHHDHDLLGSWRALDADVRLVDSTRLRRLRQGPERHAASLQAAGIDAVNLHHSDWTGGLVALYHRFDILTFAWDAQHRRILDNLVDMGMDGLYSDHTDRLMEAIDTHHP